MIQIYSENFPSHQLDFEIAAFKQSQTITVSLGFREPAAYVGFYF